MVVGIAAKIPEKGYGLIEIQFEKTVNINMDKAMEWRKSFECKMNVHAPYYGTLATEKEQKVRDAMFRIREAINIAKILRSDIVVVHAGFYAKNEPEKVFGIVEQHCRELARDIGKIKIGIETMPRPSQFGTIDEIVTLSRKIKHVEPVLNIGHSYMREGPEKVKEALEKIEHPYCHISGIKIVSRVMRYTSIENSDVDYKMLFDDMDVENMTIVCDGPMAKQDYETVKRWAR